MEETYFDNLVSLEFKATFQVAFSLQYRERKI